MWDILGTSTWNAKLCQVLHQVPPLPPSATMQNINNPTHTHTYSQTLPRILTSAAKRPKLPQALPHPGLDAVHMLPSAPLLSHQVLIPSLM